MQRPFDSVTHSKLLPKLSAYGIHIDLLSRLENYLAHRIKVVISNNVLFDFLPVTSDVMQGSVCVPILFVIYIGDLHEQTYQMRTLRR